MSRPQFQKRSTEGIRVNPRDFLPTYSSQTGARITLSGSASACARQYMRQRTGTRDHEAQALRLLVELGIMPPGEIGRLQLAALAKLESLRPAIKRRFR